MLIVYKEQKLIIFVENPWLGSFHQVKDWVVFC